MPTDPTQPAEGAETPGRPPVDLPALMAILATSLAFLEALTDPEVIEDTEKLQDTHRAAHAFVHGAGALLGMPIHGVGGE